MWTQGFLQNTLDRWFLRHGFSRSQTIIDEFSLIEQMFLSKKSNETFGKEHLLLFLLRFYFRKNRTKEV